MKYSHKVHIGSRQLFQFHFFFCLPFYMRLAVITCRVCKRFCIWTRFIQFSNILCRYLHSSARALTLIFLILAKCVRLLRLHLSPRFSTYVEYILSYALLFCAKQNWRHMTLERWTLESKRKKKKIAVIVVESTGEICI